MSERPTVAIYGADGAATGATHPMPSVFLSPIRPDIVRSMHTSMAKNKRQPYSVSKKAGHQTSAESWGTGRAVARIPRVSGGGTHRAGQAAFGNMCRSGRMFAPTKIWRKWHFKTPLGQKRFATASAIAATAVTPLLMARGHRVSHIPEVPLVVDSGVLGESFSGKTAQAIAILVALGCGDELKKAKLSKTVRAGKGKMRGRRHRQRRGPLFVYDPESDGRNFARSLRNFPGVECCSVRALNLLKLAPGGHLGRFVIWTSTAFKVLDEIYESHKRGFVLPSNCVTQADLGRLINSSEVQSVIRAKRGEKRTKRYMVLKKNPLRNKQVMLRLNPYAATFIKEKLGEQKAVKS